MRYSKAMRLLFTLIVLLATAGYGNARPITIKVSRTKTVTMESAKALRVVRTTRDRALRRAIQLELGVVNLGKEPQLGRCREASTRDQESIRRWLREPVNIDCGKYNPKP